MGDHPATLPAMMPAITVVAPRAELDRDLLLLPRLRDSGVSPVANGSSERVSVGVWGRELLLDLDPLRERISVSRGCCMAKTRLFRRPPLIRLRKVSSSFTSERGLGNWYWVSSSSIVT